MWPRFTEMVLAVWLMVAPLALPGPGSALATQTAWVGGTLVLALAALSFLERLRRAHLASLVVAGALIGVGWSAFPRPGPAEAQNLILVGLCLGLVALVPSEANRPPHGWRPWVVERPRHE